MDAYIALLIGLLIQFIQYPINYLISNLCSIQIYEWDICDLCDLVAGASELDFHVQ